MTGLAWGSTYPTMPGREPVTVDSAKGQTVIPFTNPAQTGVISVRRQDAGEVVVGWEIS